MGMGYGANYADVIEEADLEKICPKKFADFKRATKFEDLEYFARNFRSLDPCGELFESYNDLCSDFYKKTRLTLNIGFHNPEEDGDRYDEVSGVYWSVDGMYQLTKAGKKFQDVVQRKFFVTFG